MPDVDHPFPAEQLLHDARTHGTSLRVPIPLSKYWMSLKRAAENAGQRTDKQELVLALLATTPEDGPELARRLTRYRTMKNSALPGLYPRGAKIISLPAPRTGRKGTTADY